MARLTPSTSTGFGMSYPGIVELANKSGIPNRPGSRFRPGDPLNHGLGWAVDFMGFNQDALASYFMQFDTLEVIHKSEKTGKVYGSSRGKPYAPGSNQDLLNKHRDHVHIAMTPNQVKAALGGAKTAVNTALNATAGGGIPNPLAGVDQFVEGLGNMVGFFLNPQKWKPVLLLVTGTIVILVALTIIIKENGNGS